MRVKLSATRTNFLKVKKDLEIIQEGYELLDQKRKILSNELSSVMHMADRVQREMEKFLKKGYQTVDRAMVAMGRKKVEDLSLAVNIRSDLALTHRRIMGVNIPIVNVIILDHPPHYSPYEVSMYVEEANVQFKEILKLLAQLAEKKVALWRIAKELQKTIKKVNALEKIYIPSYKEAFKDISDRLDEEARDSFSMMKIIKKKIHS